MTLEELVEKISPEDIQAKERAHERWKNCCKPLGSLGELENAIESIAALTGSERIDIKSRAVAVLCADNGVVKQGVTQCESEVTAMVAKNLALGRTSVCRMAEIARCRVVPVDMGILNFPGAEGVLNRRIANGTRDISEDSAMSRADAERAVLTGAELIKELKEQGTRLVATGEMGIGNTTTASAVASVLLGCSPEKLTGRGAGLSDEGLERKKRTIERAIAINHPKQEDTLGVIAALGGFDIAGMCGMFLGGAAFGVPVIIDGVISAAAALCAARLCEKSRKAMLASHTSAEPAGELLLRELDKKPLICAGMHLGEGTGAVAAIPLLDMACAVYDEAYTFSESGMKAYESFGDEKC